MAGREEHARFQAFGSTAVVGVTDLRRMAAARAAVTEVVEAFDLACSRFRDDSELSMVNAADGEAVPVSPLLIEAVAASLRAARLTDGDVDPTVGEALMALGYDRDYALVGAAEPPRIQIVPVPGWRTINLDAEAGTIRLARGVRLDLGATAKALAADRAAEAARRAAGCGVLVSFGGDIALSGPPPNGGWRVRVTDDHRSDVVAPGQWITLESGGLATSSTTVRKWATDDGFAHHLVDPATGRPARGIWRTVSVAAGSCLDANIASTASIIRGDRALAWLQSLRLPSRLVTADGVARHIAGWPEEGDDLE
jgi:thiamine biosynthesis lipoprotein